MRPIVKLLFSDVLKNFLEVLNDIVTVSPIKIDDIVVKSEDDEIILDNEYQKSIEEIRMKYGVQFQVYPKKPVGDGFLFEATSKALHVSSPTSDLEKNGTMDFLAMEKRDDLTLISADETVLKEDDEDAMVKEETSEVSPEPPVGFPGGGAPPRVGSPKEPPSHGVPSGPPGAGGRPLEKPPAPGSAPAGGLDSSGGLGGKSLAEEAEAPPPPPALPKTSMETAGPLLEEESGRESTSKGKEINTPPAPKPQVFAQPEPVEEKKVEGESKVEPRLEDGRGKRKAKKKAMLSSAEVLERVVSGSKDMEDLDEEAKEEEAPAALPEKTKYDKNVSIDYFDVMNPENYYPLVVDIADIEQITKSIEENILTGERKTQKKEKVQLEVVSPVIQVKPLFPGCIVTPDVLEADLRTEKEVLTFYITPMVQGEVFGQVAFVSEGKVLQTIKTPAEVKNARYARVVTFYGMVASFLPKILGFIGFDLNLESINMSDLLPFVEGITLDNFIVIAGILAAACIGIIVYLTRKPNSKRIKYHVSDFRMNAVQVD